MCVNHFKHTRTLRTYYIKLLRYVQTELRGITQHTVQRRP